MMEAKWLVRSLSTYSIRGAAAGLLCRNVYKYYQLIPFFRGLAPKCRVFGEFTL